MTRNELGYEMGMEGDLNGVQRRAFMRGMGDEKVFEGQLFKCFKEAYPMALGLEGAEFLVKDRGELCFFFPFREGIWMEVAETLEARSADRREAERDRKWVRWGVWVAAVALAGPVVVKILGVIWKWWRSALRELGI